MNNTQTIDSIDKEVAEQSPESMKIEELVAERKRLDYLLDEIKGAIEVFNDEILIRLNEENLNGTIVGDQSVSKVVRFSYKNVGLEKAKDLGATKLTTDTAALKKIYMKNPELLPEVEKREGIMIRDVSQKDE